MARLRTGRPSNSAMDETLEQSPCPQVDGGAPGAARPSDDGIMERALGELSRRSGSLLPLLLALSTVQALLWAWAQFGIELHPALPPRPLTLLGFGLYQPDHDLPIYLIGAFACVMVDAAFMALLARRPRHPDRATALRNDVLAMALVVILPVAAPYSPPAWLASFGLGLAFIAWNLRRRAGGADAAPDREVSPLQPARRSRAWRDWAIPVAILAVFVVVPWPRFVLWRTFDTDQFHHFDFYVMAPALAHAHGLRLGTDFYAQYGVGWPLVLDTLGRLTGTRGYTTFIWLEMFVGCCYFLGLFAFLRAWMRSAAWALTGLLLALALALFTNTGGAPKWIWPSSTVLRYVFDIALFSVLTAHARRGDARLGPLAGAVLGLQIVFATDVGLYLAFAFCIYLVCAFRRALPGPAASSLARFGLGAAAGWMVVAGSGFAWANQGQLPGSAFWRGLTESIFVYGGGVANLPIAQAIVSHGDTALLLLAMLATYVRATGTALHACWACQVSARQALRATIAVYGMGTLLIFVGRSHDQNLLHVTIPWSLLVVESAARLATFLPQRAAGRWALALSLWLMVYIAAHGASMRYPNLVNGVAGLLDSHVGNRASWIDGAGDPLPTEPAAHLAEFRAATDAIRKVSAGGRRSVAVIAFNDTAYLLDAGVAPYFRYSPVLANLLFKEQAQGVARRLSDAPPDWIFLTTDQRALVGDGQLTDSYAIIRQAIDPAYDLLGGVGQFAVYRRKAVHP